MKAYIIRRHSPDWAALAETFKETGAYDPGDFLPDPIPPGFPANMKPLIDLWNSTFEVDFFSCRARLAQISVDSCRAVDCAEVEPVSRLSSVEEGMSNTQPSVCFFVDDDDWFSPALVTDMDGSIRGAHAIRWSAPVFRGRLIQRRVPRFFPRITMRSQRFARAHPKTLGRLQNRFRRRRDADNLELEKLDFLFQTNNYGITGRFVDRCGQLGPVADHVRAADFFMSRPGSLSIATYPGKVWSLTNKHPCSATMLAKASGTETPQESLYASVERFVREGRALSTPEAFAWARATIAETLDLFESALGA